MADRDAGPPASTGPDTDSESGSVAELIGLDARSALAVAVATGGFLLAAFVVRETPRVLTALALGALLALALNPIVDALQRRTPMGRRGASAVVLVMFALGAVLVLFLVVPEAIRQGQQLGDQAPEIAQNLEDLPLIGDDLRRADVPDKVEDWINDLPDHLDVASKPLENVAEVLADGLVALGVTLVFGTTLLIDGPRLARAARRVLPAERRRRADQLGDLVYKVLGRYIAGTLFVTSIAGTVILVTGLALGVPLAPMLALWVALANLIPQIGGALGGIPFVAFGLTQGVGVGLACLAVFLVYQQLQDHLLHPVIVGHAVNISPPATMAAALIGVAAGGFVGALLAVPVVGAVKALYLELRPPVAPDPVLATESSG